MKTTYRQIMQRQDSVLCFFCSPSWPVKTTGHSWLRNNKPRDRIKGTYLLSESVRWYPSKDLIDTNFQVIFQFSAVCDVGSWYVVLEKHWHLHFSMLSLLCSSDWHTNHTNTKTKGNQKNKKKKKTYWARVSVCDCCFCLFGFGFVLFIVYLSIYIYIYICIYIYIDTII